MGRLASRTWVTPQRFSGSASTAITVDVDEFFVVPETCFLKELWSIFTGTIDFTTGDEALAWEITFGTTEATATTVVYTGVSALANTWTDGTPKEETLSHTVQTTRIARGSVVRIRANVAGTTPSFAEPRVVLGFIPVTP